MTYILLTCPDDDGIDIKVMDSSTLLKHIEEMDKDGQPYRFLDKIPDIRNGQFMTKPFYTEEESKKSVWARARISFAVIIKGEITVPSEIEKST